MSALSFIPCKLKSCIVKISSPFIAITALLFSTLKSFSFNDALRLSTNKNIQLIQEIQVVPHQNKGSLLYLRFSKLNINRATINLSLGGTAFIYFILYEVHKRRRSFLKKKNVIYNYLLTRDEY